MTLARLHETNYSCQSEQTIKHINKTSSANLYLCNKGRVEIDKQLADQANHEQGVSQYADHSAKNSHVVLCDDHNPLDCTTPDHLTMPALAAVHVAMTDGRVAMAGVHVTMDSNAHVTMVGHCALATIAGRLPMTMSYFD